MKKLSTCLFLMVLLALSRQSNAAATLIAGWDFQTTTNGGTVAAAAPGSPTVFNANFGSGALYLNGTNSASTWITATSGNELTSFGGTAVNAGTGFSTVTSGSSALAIVSGTGNSANGKIMVFKFSMTGYTNLVISYATQSTSTGFSTHTWEYSNDSVTWSSVQAVTSIPTAFATQTLTTITGLNNVAKAFIRMKPSGATAAAGNSRLDNIQFNATALPSTSLSANALTAFGNVCTNTTSAANSFTISGNGLTTANVVVAASTGYTYSTTATGTYTNTLSLTQPGGTYSQQIFVKFTPPSTGSYTGAIGISGGGATAISVTPSGTGINTPVAVTTGASSAVTTISATAAGTPVGGCTPVTAYGIEYSTINGFTPGTGTQVASSNLSGTAFSSTLTPLLPGTTYYYRAYATDGVNNTVYGATQGSFLTTALIPTLSTTTLASFDTICTGSTSAAKSFTITGSALTTASVNVGPLAGFTFATTSGGTYSSSLALTQPGGAYSQQVFVKFAPTIAQDYSGSIPVNGGGALLAADVPDTATGISPPGAPSITGPSAPCRSTTGLIYSVTNTPGYTYTWTLPSGWSKTAGGTTSSITVTSSTNSGTISVTANNGFCSGTAGTLAVAPVAIPSQPGAISGPAAICAGTTSLTYSVTNVTGITYTWALPSGWVQTGGGTTNSITVTAGTSGGTITVTPSNTSCSGPAQILAISINPMPTITSATVGAACTGSPLALTVAGSNFSTYQWSDPASATSGQVYQQNFNNLPSTGTSVTWVDNTTIPGWYANNSPLTLGTGSNNQGDFYNFGSTGSTDRALGSLASGGTGTLMYGLRLTNTTGSAVDRVFVQYTGEQWRDGGPGASANTLGFTYSTTATALATGTYTAVTALNYVSTVQSGTITVLNGNANQTIKTGTITLATPLAAGSSIWLRWSDPDETGSNMALAIDDVTVILYTNSATDLAVQSAAVSTSTYASTGSMSSATYTATAATTPGTYTVKTTNTAGCTTTATATVAFSPRPGVSLSGSSSICAGTSGTYTATFTGTGPYAFTIDTGGGVITTTSASSTYSFTVTPSAARKVKVSSLSDNTCTAQYSDLDSINITIATGCGYTWTGATSTAWATPANWTPAAPAGGPAGCTTNVTIPVVGSSRYPVISAATTIGDIAISGGASLTLNANLSTCGDLTAGSGTSATIGGTGSLIMNGTTAQAISGTAEINTLQINKTAGAVTSAGQVSIRTALVMTQGNFTNTNKVTLVSNATATAYLDNFTSGTAGIYSGSLTAQRYIANAAIGYRDLSSPVSTTVADWAADFGVSGQDGVNCWYAYSPYPTLQVYHESDNSVTAQYGGGFISYTSASHPLTPMVGYSARLYVGAPLTIDETGTPNNGAQSVAITKTVTSVPSGDGWNMIGNPYPSPVSWSAIKALNAGRTDGSVYTFSATGEFTGNWSSFNGTAGVNGGTDQIASGQGFFVLATGNSTMTANNSVRVASSSPSFFKTRNALPDEVRLTLVGHGQTDEVVTYSDPGATWGYDPGMDAAKMAGGSTVWLGYDMPDRECAINVIDGITAQTILPLRVGVTDTGAYTLTATELNVPGLTAYLHDASTSTSYDLTTAAPVLMLDGGVDYRGRFTVMFKENTVATGITTTQQTTTHIYAYGNEVHVERSESNPATISITNLLGQEVNTTNTNSDKTNISLAVNEPWYAIVKVTEGSKVTVQKILLTNK